ncbi:MAG: putative repeat protein (TIGR03806 family) [Alteromonadaceae bacterium]|jgi:uncharacterized repeat protein (TIGR03806 family)
MKKNTFGNLLIIIFLLIGCGGSKKENTLPVVEAGNDQSVNEQIFVTLSGSGSDSDGSIASYSWSQVSGPVVVLNNNTAATTFFTAPDVNQDEMLTFLLTVTDDDKGTATDTINVEIIRVNLLPTANAGNDQQVLEQSLVLLSGEGIDVDGTIEIYQWLQVAGSTVDLISSDSANASFISLPIDIDETLTFKLTVTDNEDASHTDLVDVLVSKGIGIPFQRPENLTCKAVTRPQLPINVEFINAYPNMVFDEFIQIFRMPENSEYWYMIGHGGYVWRFEDKQEVSEKELLLDVSDIVTRRSGEEGFLTMSFHPNFSQNKKVYVYYSFKEESNHFTRLAEYTYDLDAGAFINEVELLRIPQVSVNHKGAHIEFGPDGYLYLSIGDDGFIYKDGRTESSQDFSRLNGKLLRISVPGNGTYSIPPDNPFLTADKPEIFALGFRNPWRFSFDRETGDIWGGDVGANSWEEINKIQKGGNYGWPFKEGTHCNIDDCGTLEDLVDPIFEYGHDIGFAIMGGHVYQGNAIPALKGKYIYADFASFSQIWILDYDETGTAFSTPLLSKALGVGGIRSFTQDLDGEIFANHYSGIFKMVPKEGSVEAISFPEKLSETGCFDPITLNVAAGVLPYDINSPLFTDGAGKRRWMALPEGKNISVDEDGDFIYPEGSVLIKEFSLEGKKIETRLLMLEGTDWSGYTYHWNDEQTDAILLSGGKSVPQDGFDYKIPSRSQCLQCHNTSTSFAIGPEIKELQKDHNYSEDHSVNQVHVLNDMGLLDEGVTEAMLSMQALPDYKDETFSDEERVSSYLHSNCAYCHNPTGPARGSLDFRWNKTPKWNACNVTPEISSLGIEDAKLIFPGSPERSIIYQRLNTVGLEKMPPIGRSTVDTMFVELMASYIRNETCE